jgi:hypothetical protein
MACGGEFLGTRRTERKKNERVPCLPLPLAPVADEEIEGDGTNRHIEDCLRNGNSRVWVHNCVGLMKRFCLILSRNRRQRLESSRQGQYLGKRNR